MKVEESRSGPQVSVGKALQPVLLFKAERVERLVRRPDDHEVNEDDNYEDDDLFIDLEIVFDACIAWSRPPAPGERR